MKTYEPKETVRIYSFKLIYKTTQEVIFRTIQKNKDDALESLFRNFNSDKISSLSIISVSKPLERGQCCFVKSETFDLAKEKAKSEKMKTLVLVDFNSENLRERRKK